MSTQRAVQELQKTAEYLHAKAARRSGGTASALRVAAEMVAARAAAVAAEETPVAATRIVFADQLQPGDVILNHSRHRELVVLAVRKSGGLVSGIAVDEDGEQQPLGYGLNATLRILVRDLFPAAQLTEETQR